VQEAKDAAISGNVRGRPAQLAAPSGARSRQQMLQHQAILFAYQKDADGVIAICGLMTNLVTHTYKPWL